MPSLENLPRLASDLKTVQTEIEKIYKKMVETQSNLVAIIPGVFTPQVMFEWLYFSQNIQPMEKHVDLLTVFVFDVHVYIDG